MTTTGRLWMAFGGLILLLIFCAVTLVVWLRSLQEEMTQLAAVSAPRNDAAQEMEISLGKVGLSVLNYLESGADDLRKRAVAESAQFARHLGRYRELARTPEDEDLARKVGAAFDHYDALGQRLMDQKDRNDVAEQDLVGYGQLRAELNHLLDDQLQVLAAQRAAARRERARDTIESILAAVVILLVLGLAVAVPTSSYLGRGVATTEKTLAESEARKAKIVDAALDCIVTVDHAGRIVGFNPAAERTFGYSREAALNKDVAELLVPPRMRESFRQGLANMLVSSNKESILNERLELTAVRADGSEFAVDAAVARINTAGPPVFTAFLRDISLQKHAEDELIRANETLEERVWERTAEWEESNTALARSNADLEQFASVASHDLQEPLRKIQSFGERLEHKYADALDERGRDYIGRMRAAAGRMQRLINDLLAFSRVTTKARPFEPVDLNVLVREVLSDLEGRLQETGGRVVAGDLPVIDADPLQMRQLVQNLVANGLKFGRADVPPIVQIDARVISEADRMAVAEYGMRNGDEHTAHSEFRPPSSELEMTVSDNGIGFEQEYAERIFEVFQRLHGRLDYEGTGMGLAICRKIAERHGGMISAHGRPGDGATFVVKLPLHHPEIDRAEHESAARC